MTTRDALPLLLLLATFGAVACDRGGAECDDGLEVCDGACIDPLLDPAHCGGCGAACSAGFACVEGECACPGEELACEGRCVDPRTDSANCGACGTACAGGQVCVNEACACPDGTVDCGDGCVDLRTSATNCGACGTVCPPELPLCAPGADGEPACGAECGALTECATGCADTANDAQHCGGCGEACPAGQLCAEGVCGCGDRLTCDEACVDALADETNCGACGNVCADATSCLRGTCARADLYAACFSAGTLVPLLLPDGAPGGSPIGGLVGPQALAALDARHLVVVSALDVTLRVIARDTHEVVGSLVLTTDSCPNHLAVRGTRAYVVNSCVATVQVIELADPSAPTTVDEVTTGAGSFPQAGAFDDAGTLWVTLLEQNALLPVDFSGAAGVAGTPLALPVAEGSRPNPTGVAFAAGALFVTQNNLDDAYAPAGNGRLVRVDPTAVDGAPSSIDLGATCRNPAFVAAAGDVLAVPCTGSYAGDGEVVRLSASTSSVEGRWPTGGAPTRLSLLADGAGVHGFASDSIGLGVIVLAPDLTVGALPDLCPASGFEFVADVLAFP